MTDLVAELRVLVDDDDGLLPELWWHVEYGLDGSSQGYETSSADLAEITAAVATAAQPGQPIRWVVHDDDAETLDVLGYASIYAALAQTGITLPERG